MPRLAKPLDAKGDEEETNEDQEEVWKSQLSLFCTFVSILQEEHEMADDMREADETDDDAVIEREDNQNEADSESWEGLSAENESLNQDEVAQEEEEEEVIKEAEAPVRVPELIFQDGQWVESGNAWAIVFFK